MNPLCDLPVITALGKKGKDFALTRAERLIRISNDAKPELKAGTMQGKRTGRGLYSLSGSRAGTIAGSGPSEHREVTASVRFLLLA